MWLRELIEESESAGSRLVVYNPGADAVSIEQVRDYFANFDVAVVTGPDVEHPSAPFVLLESDGRCLASVDYELLAEYLFERSVDRFDEMALPDAMSVRALLGRLDDQRYTVTDADRLPLINISRYIEKRAWQREGGTIHAGFQSLSRLQGERGTWRKYCRLADSGVAVSIYGTPDWEPPDHDGVSVYADREGLVADFWFVVYRHGEAGAALLAHESEPRTYQGFWTYDRETVIDIASYIETEIQPALES
jgi:DICT domain-containing protein